MCMVCPTVIVPYLVLFNLNFPLFNMKKMLVRSGPKNNNKEYDVVAQNLTEIIPGTCFSRQVVPASGRPHAKSAKA